MDKNINGLSGLEGARIALAYSGGLDTSVIAHWLQTEFGAEIVTVSGDLGQEKELVGIRERALALGARAAYHVDLTESFVKDYLWHALKASALYEGAYPLATALGRPLLAKSLVEIARKEECTVVAHGCTGKGNDQIRFDASVWALAPDLRVIAPVRHWPFGSREEEILYCQEHGIPVQATKESPYSIDENLWGTSIECGVLEDPTVAPPLDAYQRTVAPESAPDQAEQVTIDFEKGIPVAVNGKQMNGVALIRILNRLAGSHGVGRIDMIENRLVGIKSREIYEAPGAMLLHFAHSELERITLDRWTAHFKAKVSQDYADLIYNGLWFSPLRVALDAFVDETQQAVSGTVTVKLYKGGLTVQSRWSPNSLYDKALASYTSEDTFDHSAGEGFSKIYSLPLRTIARVSKHETSRSTIEVTS
ncbi:MAG: argininosuccinate synthase [Bacteroidota bacterium]|nr:argininosuccinate synthase [Bacteroidota bacterium]MDP4231746.1 argininosuccinate synthase [Bacteroidota bacterium]MDP4243482.1 argininosuccinate synthase [Bacteroidota bacterium]MDP4289254.1 argininosuccinate synthase [Bacteroidota bacterium]